MILTPRVGVGDVRLGASPTEILARLGPPEVTDDTETTATWYYECVGALMFACGARLVLRGSRAT